MKCHLYLNLTNTSSCLFLIIFICDFECSIKESKARELIFQILSQSEICKWLDTSNEYYKEFGVYNKTLKN